MATYLYDRGQKQVPRDVVKRKRLGHRGVKSRDGEVFLWQG